MVRTGSILGGVFAVMSMVVLGPAVANGATISVTNHLGPVEVGTVHVYAIFWEPKGTDSPYDTYLQQFISDLHGSTLIGALAGYTAQGINGTPSGSPGASVTLAGHWLDTKSQFTNSMSSNDLLSEVKHAMAVNSWTSAPGNVFLVFGGKGWDPAPRNNYCGYHTSDGSSLNPIVFGVVPRPNLAGCTPWGSRNINPTPSGSQRHDAAVDVTWHELAEMLTDPIGQGYYSGTPSTGEIGDLCRSRYPGLTGKDHHDIVLYGHQYLAQAVWVGAKNGCSVDAPLTMTPGNITARTNQLFSGSIATLIDPDQQAKAADLSAIVTWKDGSFSPATIQSLGSGRFDVQIAHTFASAGSESATVFASDNGGASLASGATTTVTTPITVESVGSNLIVNGSFEDNAFSPSGTFDLGGHTALTGWTSLSNGTYPWGLPYPNIYNGGPTPYGNQWVIVGNFYLGGTWIEQTLNGLTPGQTYSLSFASASEQHNGVSQALLEVSFPSGSSTPSQTFTAPLAKTNSWDTWASSVMSFQANSSSVSIRFTGLAGQGGDPGIDNVSVR